MPELPEVQTVVTMLQPLIGRTIQKALVLHKPTVSGSVEKLDGLRARKIERIHRRGKYIRFDLDGGKGLLIHLRMTGWLGEMSADEKRPKIDPYIRVRMVLDDGAHHLVFSDIRTFGRVWYGAREKLDAHRSLSALGPEPLEISADEFTLRLKSHRSRVKSLLLNQTFLAGVGNIYADEALFAAGIHPLAEASRVSAARAAQLHAAIQAVLNASIAAGGSSVENFRRPDGESGWYQRELKIYGRAGTPCTRCGADVKRIVVGQRGTWFCGRCQRR
jgi:formamidopyrimidine-DNA glycosylase